MLLEMNLKNLLKPAALLEDFELEKLCSRLIPAGTKWSIEDGRINVTGVLDITRFIDHGKLIAPFGEVTTMMLTVGNVHTLKGFPQIVHGVVDIRSSWLESLEGGPQVTDSLYIEANYLKSLEHGPSSVMFYGVTSEALTSLKGVSKKGIGTLAVAGCNSIKTTEGLEDVHLEALKLPPDMSEITEYPEHCIEITYPICAGFPRLFLTEGLKSMVLGDVNKAKTPKPLIEKVVDICEQVLSIEGAKRRYLEAQTLLIDADLEELL
jgi:hypothetical protein